MVSLNLILNNRRGQAWGTDLVLAVSIFFLALTAIYFYSINDLRPSQENLDNLFYDGNLISESLLSSGHPVNWSEADVTEIGILDGGKINDTKLELFHVLASTNYPRTKLLFNTEFDYYFFLEDNMTINSAIVDGIGKPGVNRYNISSENLIKVTRVVVYGGEITAAYLYIFE